MTATSKLSFSLGTLFVLLLVAWLIFMFLPQAGPVTQTTATGFVWRNSELHRMTINGLLMTALASLFLVSAALMKQGKLPTGGWWGRSAAYAFWFGLGFFIIGLSNLSHLVLGNTMEAILLEGKLKAYASIIALGLIIVGTYRARAAKAS